MSSAKKLFKVSIHPSFCINGRSLTAADLVEAGYSYIKEGAEFENQIGQFFLDWLDGSPTIKVNTSGSTGTPKSILLKKEQMINSALATGRYFGLSANDTALLCLPAAYIAGKMMLVRAMVLGLNLHIVPPTSDPLSYNVKNFDFGAMVPLQVLNSLPLVHKIKTLLIGGAPVSAELKSKLSKMENRIYETYGMTETITHIAVKQLNKFTGTPKYGTSPFHTLPDVTVSMDERRCLVIDAPKVSGETIITNDVVELISSTEFIWLGRFDTIINSGGIKIHPERIEGILSGYFTMPFFVAGVSDKNLGQKLVLVIEGEGELGEIEKVLRSVKGLTKFEKPKQIVVTDQFERTENGKIQRSKSLQKVLKVFKNDYFSDN